MSWFIKLGDSLLAGETEERENSIVNLNPTLSLKRMNRI